MGPTVFFELQAQRVQFYLHAVEQGASVVDAGYQTSL